MASTSGRHMTSSHPEKLGIDGEIFLSHNWNYEPLMPTETTATEFTNKDITPVMKSDTASDIPTLTTIYHGLVDLLKSFNFGKNSNTEQQAIKNKILFRATVLTSEEENTNLHKKNTSLHHKNTSLHHKNTSLHQKNTTSHHEPMKHKARLQRHKHKSFHKRNKTTTLTTPLTSEKIYAFRLGRSNKHIVTPRFSAYPHISTYLIRKNDRPHGKKKRKGKTTETTATTETPTTGIPNSLQEVLAKLGVTPVPPTEQLLALREQSTTTQTPKKDPGTAYNYLHPPNEKSDLLYGKAHFVKCDSKIKDFTLQIFRHNLNIFANVKARLNDSDIKHKIDLAARSYSNKFAEFVNETQYRKIVTRLGTQKVILNTIETSNRIINRLLIFLVNRIKGKHSISFFEEMSVKLKNEIDNEEQQQYVYACQIFNICRAKHSFSNFLAAFLTILLQTDNTKLKQGVDALTEVLKDNNDLDQIGDHRMKARLKNNIEAIEVMEPDQLRSMIWMFRNMLLQRNQPIVLQPGYNQMVLNKSIAILDIMNIMDEKIPSNEENMLQLNDIRNSLVQWANNQRTDILEIMQVLIRFINKKAIGRMNSNFTKLFQENLKILLKKRFDGQETDVIPHDGNNDT